MSDALGLDGAAQERLQTIARTIAAEIEVEKPPVTNQLPPDIPDFIGRRKPLSLLHSFFQRSEGNRVAMAAIFGRAGIGKTALAVHAAHRLGDRFPDGRLFVSLRGATPDAREPAEVLASLLRALGLAGSAIPDGVDARAELYRLQLAPRRVLVVLDDAGSEAQVRPLLPGSPPSAALITSRPELVSLDGPWRLSLDGLEPVESMELLGRLIGEARTSAERADARRIVHLCDHLPLAVRIAGAKLAARPDRPLAHLAARLADESARLDVLAQGDLEVRASIGLSYARLDLMARRGCRRLSLVDAPDFPAWVTAVMLDVPQTVADRVIDQLCEAQLLEPNGPGLSGQDRYRFHDLVRLFGWERAQSEEPVGERTAAVSRMLHGWLGRAEPAERALRQGAGESIAWFDGELQSLVAAVAHACRLGLGDLACRLASSLVTHCAFRGLFDEWQRTHELVLATPPEPGSPLLAIVRKGLGDLHTIRDRYDEALACYREALLAFQRGHDHRQEAAMQQRIGCVLRLQGRHSEALTCFERALTLTTERRDRRTWALAMIGVATVYLDRGGNTQARGCLQRALAASREVGFTIGEARALRTLGIVHQAEGDLDGARDHLEQALALTRQLRDLTDEMHVVLRLGDVSRRQGRLDEGAQHLGRCLAHYESTGDRSNTACTLRCLGELHLEEGALDLAVDCLSRSAAIYEQLQLPVALARTKESLAAARAISATRATWGRWGALS